MGATMSRIVILCACVTVLALMGLVSCGPSREPGVEIAIQTPVGTALAWFQSVNTHDKSLALAHFASADRDKMEWSDFGSISFDNVQCQPEAETATTAAVRCTFAIRDPSPDVRSDTFWDIYFERQPSGPWLITDYGQG